MILDTYTKQPDETMDYDVDYVDWLTTGDSISTRVVTADAGITVASSSISGTIIKVWLSGGTTGVKYKITVKATTTGGRIKEDEFYVKCREF